MEVQQFAIRPYPELWESLGMDVPRFDKMRSMMGEIFYCHNIQLDLPCSRRK